MRNVTLSPSNHNMRDKEVNLTGLQKAYSLHRVEQILEAGSQEAATVFQTSENGKDWTKVYVLEN